MCVCVCLLIYGGSFVDVYFDLLLHLNAVSISYVNITMFNSYIYMYKPGIFPYIATDAKTQNAASQLGLFCFLTENSSKKV